MRASNLLERLAALPSFAPPDSLRDRIQAIHALRARRRVILPAALAAGIALAFVAFAPRIDEFGVAVAPRVDAPAAAVARTVARSQALEADLLEAGLAGTRRGDGSNPGILAAEAELARVDLALQSAYDRRASAVELERLWQARTALLSTLVAAYRYPDAVVRI